VKGAKDFRHYGPSKKEQAYTKVEAQWDHEMHQPHAQQSQHVHPVAHATTAPGQDLLEFPLPSIAPTPMPPMPTQRQPEDWRRPNNTNTNTNSIANDDANELSPQNPPKQV
jgi:hypothetical protein